jgi:hypothetical protein
LGAVKTGQWNLLLFCAIQVQIIEFAPVSVPNERKDTAKWAIGKKNGKESEKIKGVPKYTLNLKVVIGLLSRSPGVNS